MPKKQKDNSNLLEIQNAAKTMFANIRFQSIDDPIRSVLLTSAVPDEGKTTTAWYLAQAMATAGNIVLLVEGDMRRRSLANMLQLHPQNGLFAVLTGNANLEDVVLPTSVRGLYFLDAEPSIPNPPDVLASKRMGNLNERLLEEFDYVVYDTPPVGTFVDAAVLSTVVDGVVLVVRPGRPKRTELQMAYTQLENADANILGICTTFVEGTGSDYYYSYYTKGGRSKRGEGKDLEFVLDSSIDSAHGTVSVAALSAQPGDNLKAGGTSDAWRNDRNGRDDFEGDEPERQGGEESDYAYVDTAQPQASKPVKAPKPAKPSRGGKGGISIPRGTPPRGKAGKSGIVHDTPAGKTTRLTRL